MARTSDELSTDNRTVDKGSSSQPLANSTPSQQNASKAATQRKHRWAQLPESYRSSEVAQIAEWIRTGESGCVVGLAESGRSNLLTFLSHRSEVLQPYLADSSTVTIIPVDIFNLPANDLSSLYRTILHGFYWEREGVAPELHRYATELYLENRATEDPFLPQMALYDLLRAFEDADQRVVLILNRFDRFCATATPQMLNTLRGLRDTFKGTLFYIVGMLQEAIYLADEAQLGDMYDILDRHVCWVGDMTVADARFMLFRDVLPANHELTDDAIVTILRLSGRFPGLLKTVGLWWCDQDEQSATPNPSDGVTIERLEEVLLAENSVRFRLERIWNCLTQEEQLALSEIQKVEASLPPSYDPMVEMTAILAAHKSPTVDSRGIDSPGVDSPDVDSPNGLQNGTDLNSSDLNSSALTSSDLTREALPKSTQKVLAELTKRHEYTLARLVTKGLCQKIGQTWWINSSLLSAFVETREGRARGRIWLDDQTKQIHQGQQIIQDLPGLQHAILAFLVQNPRVRHTNDEIINSAWPDEDQREGISDNALQVHIRSIRKRLEPNPAKPNYLVTWRGNPGGYIFYPEGKPD